MAIGTALRFSADLTATSVQVVAGLKARALGPTTLCRRPTDGRDECGAGCAVPWGDADTLPVPPPPAAASATDSLARTSELVAGRIANEAVLQLGVGRIPDAALARLIHRSGLGVWSEMISDGGARLG